MKNPEQIIDKLLEEHAFLKLMQETVIQNYDILLQNQKQNTNNHEEVIKNQSTIIRNQEIIVNNQMNIVKNQKSIVQNQATLDVILQTQAHILNLVKHLTGSKESLKETINMIEQFRINFKESVIKSFNDPQNIS